MHVLVSLSADHEYQPSTLVTHLTRASLWFHGIRQVSAINRLQKLQKCAAKCFSAVQSGVQSAALIICQTEDYLSHMA